MACFEAKLCEVRNKGFDPVVAIGAGPYRDFAKADVPAKMPVNGLVDRFFYGKTHHGVDPLPSGRQSFVFEQFGGGEDTFGYSWAFAVGIFDIYTKADIAPCHQSDGQILFMRNRNRNAGPDNGRAVFVRQHRHSPRSKLGQTNRDGQSPADKLHLSKTARVLCVLPFEPGQVVEDVRRHGVGYGGKVNANKHAMRQGTGKGQLKRGMGRRRNHGRGQSYTSACFVPSGLLPAVGVSVRKVECIVATCFMFAGCERETPKQFLAFVRDPDGSYLIGPRSIPALTDPATLSGDLGTVEHGGRLTGDDLTGPWSGGVPLSVEYDVQDGVAVPFDADGVALFSFYGHLGDVADMLSAAGEPVDELFPVAMAWNPAVSPLFELSPADNAAYATGQHLFVLLPDGGEHPVPLLANAGVVAHESAHMVFHAATAGGVQNPPVVTSVNTEAAFWQASLHEGVADAMAALWLDDPRFLDASFALDSRALDADAVYVESMDPERAAAEAKDDLLYFYDPYSLGTVWARTIWSIRVATGDLEGTRALLFRTIHAFDAENNMNGDGFAAGLIASTAAEGPECLLVRDTLLEAFGSAVQVPPCP